MAEKLKAGDLLRPPLQSEPKVTLDLSTLPESWRTVVEKTEEWPFVDPDVMLEEETDSFGDFPTDPDELPEGIVPFSEYEPWGKMEQETNRDYELFSHYRSSGLSRTFTKTAKKFGISQPYVSKRARLHDWDERVRAWDEYREQIYTSSVIEQTRKMAGEHAKIANKGIHALSMVFDELNRRIEEDPELHEKELSEIGFRSLFGLAEKAARAIPNLMNAERLSRGLPTELTAEIQVKENRVTIQTTDELAEIVSGLQDVLDVGGGELELDEADYEEVEEVEDFEDE